MASTDLAHFFGDYNQLRYPVVFYQNELLALSVQSNGKHRFGGLPTLASELPSKFYRQLLRLDVLALDIIEVKQVIPEVLDLVFDFNLFTLSVQYLSGSGGPVWLDEIDSEQQGQFPYDTFPATFPDKCLGELGRHYLDFDEFQRRFTPQGLDGHDKMFVLIPPYEGFGLSLWGKRGDDEGTLIVFEIDPQSGYVEGHTQAG